MSEVVALLIRLAEKWFYIDLVLFVDDVLLVLLVEIY
jgi:hypothetical protein